MYEKIIVSNNVVEIYTYEHLNVDSKRDMDMSYIEKGEGSNKDENYSRRQKTRRDSIRRIVCQNFRNSTSKFITFTFRDTSEFNIKSIRDCNKEFKKFIKRLNYYFKSNDLITDNIPYVSVIEFQDKNGRGAVHYHMICDMPFINRDDLANIWGHGFIKINAINKVDNLGAYVVKYMTKETKDTRLYGEKGYLCSQNLKRPIEYKSWEDGRYKDMVSLKERLSLDKREKVYFAEYKSDNAGQVTYSQFNLERER